MPPDAARYAAMSDPAKNPSFQRIWEDPCQPLPPPSPRPFVSIGEAAQRVTNRLSEERLRRQIREIFGDA